jgi:alkanesulfonate monooxygenase SsuD/methylene tetrahydromethanopterin reductase-like flavin-dependent oxidoreductase (luciferase family)
LRVVAEHADVWNFPGDDLEAALQRGAVLDRICSEIGRDPTSITRSLVMLVSYDQPSLTRHAIAQAIDAGFHHFVLALPSPYPTNAARWVADELILPSI